ncbi:MAG: hypothetical protein GY796_35555 [Chloroflexi bacterium]|nr:hypothetical protein [Chloroflexota bacterium]
MDFDEEQIGEVEQGAGGKLRPHLLQIGLLGLAAAALIAIFLFLNWNQPGRPLRPFYATPTGISLIVDGQPELVTFPELSNNAAQYHNQRIRVTGRYLRLTLPECALYNGPVIQWALVSDGLQLNAQGFEKPLSIISSGTTLTIEGIWRLYTGPVGCGKAPPSGNVWYLDVEQIVQPNPLVASTRDSSLLSGINTPEFPELVTRTGSSASANTPTSLPTGTAVFPTSTVETETTPSATPLPGNPTPTGPPTTLPTITPTPTRFIISPTPTATNTGSAGTPTPTVGSSTATPSATNGPPTQPTTLPPYPINTPPPGSTPLPTSYP